MKIETIYNKEFKTMLSNLEFKTDNIYLEVEDKKAVFKILCVGHITYKEYSFNLYSPSENKYNIKLENIVFNGVDNQKVFKDLNKIIKKETQINFYIDNYKLIFDINGREYIIKCCNDNLIIPGEPDFKINPNFYLEKNITKTFSNFKNTTIFFKEDHKNLCYVLECKGEDKKDIIFNINTNIKILNELEPDSIYNIEKLYNIFKSCPYEGCSIYIHNGCLYIHECIYTAALAPVVPDYDYKYLLNFWEVD